MHILQLKKIKKIKSQYARKTKQLRDEIDSCQMNLDREEIMNKEFGQKDWGIELDNIYNHDKEIIRLNTERIEQLKEEERRSICKVLEK